MANDSTDQRLVPLGELSDYRVAPGNPDIRGWEIFGANEQRLGEVRELIVDVPAKKARYLVASFGRTFLGLGKHQEALIPIGRVRLDDVRDHVYLDGVTEADLASFPAFDRATFAKEGAAALGADYAHPDYDETRAFHKRRAGESYLADTDSPAAAPLDDVKVAWEDKPSPDVEGEAAEAPIGGTHPPGRIIRARVMTEEFVFTPEGAGTPGNRNRAEDNLPADADFPLDSVPPDAASPQIRPDVVKTPRKKEPV